MVRALVDGVVFENGGQMGIWRSFYEVMTRLSNQVDYTLLLRSKPVQALPGGVRLVCDSAQARAARWNLIGRAARDWAGFQNREGCPPPMSITQPTLPRAQRRAYLSSSRFTT